MANVPALKQFQWPNLMGIERNALAIQGGQTQNALLETQAEAAKYNLEEIRMAAPLKRQNALVNSIMASASRISWEQYPEYYAFYEQSAQETDVPNPLPHPDKIIQGARDEGYADVAQYFEESKRMTFESVQDQIARQKAGTEEYKAETGRIKAEKGEKWEDPYVDKATGALMQKNKQTGKINKIATPPKGMVIESDGAGGFTIRTGVPTDTDVTKKTQAGLEEKIMNGMEQYQRIQAIATEFKPEYQEIGKRLGATWTSVKAKFGKDVSEDDANFLTAFKKYQRKAIENINKYIKEMTGAQMSEKEASRLRLAQPDPGEKWYSGDDPITFKAKMDDVLKTVRAAVARYEYYRAKGIGDEEIRAIINSDKALSLESLMEKM